MSKKKYEKPVVNVTKYDISDRVCSGCGTTSVYVTCLITGLEELAHNCTVIEYNNTKYLIWYNSDNSGATGSMSDSGATWYDYLRGLLSSSTGVTINGTTYTSSNCKTEYLHIAEYAEDYTTLMNS